MSPRKDPARHQKGTPVGGRFAPDRRGEADVDLTGAVGEEGAPGFGDVDCAWDDPDAPVTEDVLSADAERLTAYVRHRNPYVRAEAATNANITSEHLVELADPSQPWIVRQTVAQTPHYGVADRASHDPDPVIRRIARRGFDLSPENARRLDQDEHVASLTALIEAERVQPA